MRQIGALPDGELAKQFVDYLLTEGIATRAEQEDDGTWLIWAIQEDDFAAAKKSLQHFAEAPQDSRYRGLSSQADALRAEKRARALQAKKNVKIVRAGYGAGIGNTARRIPATFGLIVICIGVALWTGLGSNDKNTDPLMFVSHRHRMDENWDPTNANDATIDVRAGQLWRVITPAVIHLGPLHLVFNMMWLHMLGGQIESRKGKTKYLLMVLAIAVFSNLVQVYVAKYPFFGGMSGVVYGLFGYIWMKCRFDPADGFYLSRQNVNLMLIWFAICFLPMFGVANGGHAGGLLLGAVMGYASSQMR